jgi:hypothetical protein
MWKAMLLRRSVSTPDMVRSFLASPSSEGYAITEAQNHDVKGTGVRNQST